MFPRFLRDEKYTSVSVGGADYQNQPPTCMAGYPCNGICPVCEHSNQVNNRRKEQQKGTTLSNYNWELRG